MLISLWGCSLPGHPVNHKGGFAFSHKSLNSGTNCGCLVQRLSSNVLSETQLCLALFFKATKVWKHKPPVHLEVLCVLAPFMRHRTYSCSLQVLSGRGQLYPCQRPAGIGTGLSFALDPSLPVFVLPRVSLAEADGEEEQSSPFPLSCLHSGREWSVGGPRADARRLQRS